MLTNKSVGSCVRGSAQNVGIKVNDTVDICARCGELRRAKIVMAEFRCC